jgi:predicted metalloprotease with PDZ domain
VGQNRTTSVSYYVKGPVVGFLLDAKIRRATGGRKSLDDVMRLAYKRYAQEHGFTPDQFRMTAEDVAGVDLKDWFRRAISSTDELDYTEALGWFGLKFAPAEEPAKKSSEEQPKKPPEEQPKKPPEEQPKKWKLEIRADSTESQKGRLRELFRPAGGS